MSTPSSFFSVNSELVDSELRKLLGESLRIDDVQNTSPARLSIPELSESPIDEETLFLAIQSFEHMERNNKRLEEERMRVQRLKEREETMEKYRMAKILFDMTRSTDATSHAARKEKQKNQELKQKVSRMEKTLEQVTNKLTNHLGLPKYIVEKTPLDTVDENLSRLSVNLKIVQQLVNQLDRKERPQVHHYPHVNSHPLMTMHHVNASHGVIGPRIGLQRHSGASAAAEESQRANDLKEYFEHLKDFSTPVPSLSTFMAARKQKK